MRIFLMILIMCIIVPSACAFDKQQDTPETSVQTQSAEKVYTFEEEDVMSGKVIKLKEGTTLPVILQTPLDTSVTKKNDDVVAMLDEDLVYEGAKIAEKGSLLYGKVTQARSASKYMRGGKVTVDFDKIVTTENKTYRISAQELEFKVQEDGFWIKSGRMVLTIAAVAAYIFFTGGAGAVVIAALVATGAGTSALSGIPKGTDAVIPASTPMEVSLDSSLNVVATY